MSFGNFKVTIKLTLKVNTIHVSLCNNKFSFIKHRTTSRMTRTWRIKGKKASATRFKRNIIEGIMYFLLIFIHSQFAWFINFLYYAH